MKYLEQGFKTAQDFAKMYKHHGLLLLFGDEPEVRAMTSSMDGDLAKKYIKKHGRNILYKDDVLMRLYEEMSYQDGALGFDREGNLIDTGLMIKAVDRDRIPKITLEKIRKIKGNEGTRHISAAYASAKGAPTIAVSEEAGSVMTFVKGYLYVPQSAQGESVQEIADRIKEKCQRINNRLSMITSTPSSHVAYL